MPRLALLLLFAFSCSGRDKSPATTAPDTATQRPERPGLVRSEPLPELARKVLHERMTEHGDDMESLLWSVLMLDHDTAASIAERISRTPKLSRPDRDPNTVNAALPERFFELQDQLYDGAAELRRAALARDDAAVARTYAKISSACISCHSLYLRLPPVPEQ